MFRAGAYCAQFIASIRMDGNMSVNLEWLSSLDFPLAENLVVYDLEGFLNADVNKKGQY